METQSRRRFLRGAAALAAVPFAARRWPAGGVPAPLAVAAGTPVIADIVARVGGARTAVFSVIPADADPHTYEATPDDIVRVGESDAFVFMGAHLEPFIESGAWRRAVQDAGIPTLQLAEHLSLIKVDKVIDHGDHVHDLREGDPHVWLDPLKVVELVDVVEPFLAGLDPAGAADYAANAAVYREELAALDAELTESFAAIPPKRRKLVVFHDAFTYFSARYGFDVVGVVLNNPSAEPSAKEFAALAATIDEAGIGVVFAEPQFDAGLLESLAAETGVEVGMLLTDTFAEVVGSYLELMRFNRDSLVRHLASV